MYIVGITGASGSILGIRLIEELLCSGKDVVSIVSDSAWRIIHYEIFRNKKTPSTVAEVIKSRNYHPDYNFNNLKEYKNDDFFSPPASGTSKFDALIVMPCSMKSLAGIASGYADNLISRAADVALKENRKCVLVPRETPLSLIHLENLLKVKQAGADVLVPVPSFYTFPETLDDIVNFVVGKTLNLLGIEHKLFTGWSETI